MLERTLTHLALGLGPGINPFEEFPRSMVTKSVIVVSRNGRDKLDQAFTAYTALQVKLLTFTTEHSGATVIDGV